MVKLFYFHFFAVLSSIIVSTRVWFVYMEIAIGIQLLTYYIADCWWDICILLDFNLRLRWVHLVEFYVFFCFFFILLWAMYVLLVCVFRLLHFNVFRIGFLYCSCGLWIICLNWILNYQWLVLIFRDRLWYKAFVIQGW